jgi:hypothetical protein
MSQRSKTDRFILYKLKSRLHYLESRNPTLYEAVDKEGKVFCSFNNVEWIEKFDKEGNVVRQVDIEEELRALKASIASYERLVAEGTN